MYNTVSFNFCFIIAKFYESSQRNFIQDKFPGLTPADAQKSSDQIQNVMELDKTLRQFEELEIGRAHV